MEKNKLENFLELIKKHNQTLQFQIIEIGAHPYGGKEEPFYKLLDFFPNSKIYAFEINKNECDKLNKISKKGIQFFPYALGEKKEKKKFYETNHPMCSSLYEPDEKFIKLYNNLKMAQTKTITELETITLHQFIEEQKIKNVDFIKIDVQGAELDIFKGAKDHLAKVLTIISEVEFVPIYKNQPLFGDIYSFLKKKNLMFHKFLDIGGRSLLPVKLNDNINFATQHIWSDAVFVKNILEINQLDDIQLLKLSVFAFLYGSPDLTFFCLLNYDKKKQTDISESFKSII